MNELPYRWHISATSHYTWHKTGNSLVSCTDGACLREINLVNSVSESYMISMCMQSGLYTFVTDIGIGLVGALCATFVWRWQC